MTNLAALPLLGGVSGRRRRVARPPDRPPVPTDQTRERSRHAQPDRRALPRRHARGRRRLPDRGRCSRSTRRPRMPARTTAGRPHPKVRLLATGERERDPAAHPGRPRRPADEATRRLTEIGAVSSNSTHRCPIGECQRADPRRAPDVPQALAARPSLTQARPAPSVASRSRRRHRRTPQGDGRLRGGRAGRLPAHMRPEPAAHGPPVPRRLPAPKPHQR